MPAKDYDKIKSVSEDLQLKTEAITKATLSKRLESKAELFKAAAMDLYEAAKEYNAACQSGAIQAIEKAIDRVHTKYKVLEKIFE